MFDLLKKKLGGFREKLKKKVGAGEAVSGEVVKGPPEEEEIAKEKLIAAEPALEEAKEAVEKEIGVPVEEKVEASAIEEKHEEAAKGGPRELKAKVSAASRLKRAFGKEITIHEKDLKGLLWELELSLLESDVEQTTAEEISREMKQRLVGKKIGKGQEIDNVLKEEIGNALSSMMKTEQKDILGEIKGKGEKPYRILFLGPNGAGKTTTMAKLTHMLQSEGLKVIWSASDTFRAASIEQLEKHAEKLGVRVVKHGYGADPAAVAFDAIKAAQSKGIDVVMIDSAGRQETDKNLMQELQKIVRVAQPDLKLYIGEAFTGQALLQQAHEYGKIVGIDGFVLTKIDTDAKGGTVISLLYKMKKPVLFVGTGQGYGDLQKFEPEFVLERVLG